MRFGKVFLKIKHKYLEMDFKKLVMEQVNQADPEEEKAKSSAAFLLKPEVYEKLKKTYIQKYGNFESFRNSFPPEQDYRGLVYTAANAAVRTTKDSERYPNIRDIFPLLDLIGLVVRAYSNTSNLGEKGAEKELNDFITRLQSSQGAPIEYNPIDNWAKAVKDDFFGGRQKIDLGKIRLENPEFQNQSIYFVIQKLMQLRLTSRAGILKLDDPNIPKKSQQFVDKFLLDPNSYINGTKPVPDQQIKDLYNDTTPMLLLEACKNAYIFFEQQADLNIEGGVKSLAGQTKEAYSLFINNKIDWGLFKSKQPATNLQTSSLTKFSQLTNKLLSEANSNWGDKAVSTMKPKASEPIKDPFKDENGKNNYSLGKIIASKNQVSQANNLYISLVKLADYLRKEIQFDWKGLFDAASKIVQGLSFGVPTQGGKR